MARQGLGARPMARCLNPDCKFAIQWRHGQPAPKACPRCGYSKSQDDLNRIREQQKLTQERKVEEALKKYADEQRVKDMAALPWYKRWAIGLGLAKYKPTRVFSAQVGPAK